jgi:RNA polymerase sigma-54 factor
MHQTQNLSMQQVLAPQLQQSLLILQAPLLELRNLVQQEMETNPVLEELATEPIIEGEEAKTVADAEFKEEFDQLAKLDEEWRDYMAQSRIPAARRRRRKNANSFSIRSRRRKLCSNI